MELLMGKRLAQQERNAAIYARWIDGAREVDLAEQYQVSVSAISQSIKKVQDELPPREKAAEIIRAADLCDGMLATYIPRARNGNMPASREARGWLSLKAKWLGIDRRDVNVHHDGEVTHTWEPGPTMEQLLERWRRDGTLRTTAELTRLDRSP
jgi:hypothetical protein